MPYVEVISDRRLGKSLEELLQDEFQGKSEIAKKIIEKHSINYDYCEGKGEWENDYIKVVDSSDEILFEDGKW